MFNTDLLWYLLVPLLLSVATFFGLRRARPGMSMQQLLGATGGGLAISALLLTSAFFVGKGMKTHDVEVLNGYVVGKTRDHGHYLRPYECNCITQTTCSGSGSSRTCSDTRVCQTCYEDRYTVSWNCQSTIGPFRIKHLDEGSRSVYEAPDPARYVSITQGDPVSRTNGYTNYIKAVPESLFRPAQESLRTQFASMIPAYPNRIHDIYRINRVVGAGLSVPNANHWNALLSDELKTLGGSHEVNAVLVFAKTDDPNYFHALQDAWINGKKNDVVVVVGVDSFDKAPLWVNVMSLTKSSLFQVKLVDRIQALEKIEPESFVSALAQTIRSDYRRRPMADFKYLEVEIDPPAWLICVALMLIVGAYAGFWVYTLRAPKKTAFSRYGMPHFHRTSY